MENRKLRASKSLSALPSIEEETEFDQMCGEFPTPDILKPQKPTSSIEAPTSPEPPFVPTYHHSAYPASPPSPNANPALTKTLHLLTQTRTRLHHAATQNHTLTLQISHLYLSLTELDAALATADSTLAKRTQEYEDAKRACEQLRKEMSGTVDEFRAALRCIDGLEVERARLVRRLRDVQHKVGVLESERAELRAEKRGLEEQVMGFEILWLRGK